MVTPESIVKNNAVVKRVRGVSNVLEDSRSVCMLFTLTVPHLLPHKEFFNK